MAGNEKGFPAGDLSSFEENASIAFVWTSAYAGARLPQVLRGAAPHPVARKKGAFYEKRYDIQHPNCQANPFGYLKKMNPDYEKAIDLIVSFWTSFGASEIRKKYNYIKHKGKPAYSEIVSLQGGKLIGLYKQSKGEERVAVPSDVRDVQWEVSLEDSIAELYHFDDEQLFPYLEGLFRELERVVDPSPIVD